MSNASTFQSTTHSFVLHKCSVELQTKRGDLNFGSTSKRRFRKIDMSRLLTSFIHCQTREHCCSIRLSTPPCYLRLLLFSGRHIDLFAIMHWRSHLSCASVYIFGIFEWVLNIWNIKIIISVQFMWFHGKHICLLKHLVYLNISATTKKKLVCLLIDQN